MDVHELGHRLHERVAEPLRELVEGDDGFPGLRGGGYGHGGKWPGVTKGGAVYYGA